MTELLDVAANVVGYTLGRGEQLEAYVVHRVSTAIQVDTHATVRQVSVAEVRGVGVRVIQDERLGYASTSDLDQAALKLTVERARANAAATDRDVAQVLPDAHAGDSIQPAEGLSHVELQQASLSGKVDLVVDLARRVVALDPRVPAIDTAGYYDEMKSVAVASTRGVSSMYQSGYLEIWSDALGEDRHGKAVDDAYQIERSPNDCNVEQIAANAVERTVNLLGRPVSPPDSVRVIFDPAVVADLLHAVGKGLSGGAISSGRSPFASKTGTTIAPPWLQLDDDGTSPLSSAAAAFDDEGLPRRRTRLVKDGVLVGAMHSTVTARAVGDGAAATGNARRSSHKSVPKAAPNCLVLQPTRTREDILSGGGRAIYIQQLTGAGAGINSVTGRIDVGGVGWLLEDGQNVGPISTVAISTSLPAFLQSIRAIGDDTYQSASAPAAVSTVECGSELLNA
ncbi:MAG TPA: TldD/PmbA family protein [Actinomycetes bacterium]|nr:TldD/PmbA family protein [Actinomycetes bacterium]